ncbi:MAG: helix-turn-helix transcriptional regulator [Clostridia bacterium]|nr:helix-turn-helix transcriptional regulator [Clostridia bacterium]
MSIGTTIKNLRRSRNITQEQLAEMLGVSTNAVSQWECDKTAPDISHLPVLANIFEVSADVLLEIDIAKSKKQAEIKEFTAKYAELHNQGKTEERLKLSRAMQKKYPNDETVRYYLMRALQTGYIDEYFDEIVMLGEQLLDSSNSEYRTGAIRGLCFTYLHKGDRAKALQYADMMPPAEDLHLHVLEGEALVEHCQNYFWKVCDKMHLYMTYLLNHAASDYTHEEKHTMWRSLYDTFHLIFADKDFGFYHDRLARISFFMALESGKAEKFETAIEDLERMLVHLENYNKFTKIAHSSLLVNKIKIDHSNIFKSSTETLGHAYLRYLNNDDNVFIAIKDDSRYTALKDRLAVL